MEAHAFNDHIPSFGLQGLVLNVPVMTIMALLGASLWLLCDCPTADTFSTLLCTVSSSGGQLDKLKKRIAVAALAWIVGSMQFSLILVDDMTSSITIPNLSWIPKLQNCREFTSVSHHGRNYSILSEFMFWELIPHMPKFVEVYRPLICAPRLGIERIRRILNIRNLFRVEVENAARNWFIAPDYGW